MRILLIIVAIWFGLNLALPVILLWQRSPHFRHLIFRSTLGFFVPRRVRVAHVLLRASRH
jgi:hypothetical protein